MKKGDVLLIIFVALFLVSTFLWFFSLSATAPQFAPAVAPSKVNIGQIYGAVGSPSLASGIDFGSASPPISDVPANHNTDGVGTSSTFFVDRDPSSTVSIKLCINANDNLREQVIGTDTIALSGETYLNSSTSTPAGPAGSIALVITPTVSSSGIMTAGANRTYYRFWLDVPNVGQAAGNYNNTITFSALPSTAACT